MVANRIPNAVRMYIDTPEGDLLERSKHVVCMWKITYSNKNSCVDGKYNLSLMSWLKKVTRFVPVLAHQGRGGIAQH
jgi:hypothetical protein